MSTTRTRQMKRQYQQWRDAHSKQQKNRCAYCLCKMRRFDRKTQHIENGRTADHIVPLSSFGRNVFYNVLAVCAGCNLKKDCDFLTFKQMINVIRIKKLMSIPIAFELISTFLMEGLADALYEFERKDRKS